MPILSSGFPSGRLKSSTNRHSDFYTRYQTRMLENYTLHSGAHLEISPSMAVCHRVCWEVSLILRIRLCFLRESTTFMASTYLTSMSLKRRMGLDPIKTHDRLYHSMGKVKNVATIRSMRDLTAFASLLIWQTKIIVKRLISTDSKVTYRPSTDAFN